MINWREVTVATALLAVSGGCASIAPTAGIPDEKPGSAFVAGLRREWARAAEGIRSDLKALDSDDDGLDGFGPVAAREMRSMRAELPR